MTMYNFLSNGVLDSRNQSLRSCLPAIATLRRCKAGTKSAFSILELLISFALVGLIIGIALIFSKEASSLDIILDNSAAQIVSLLRTAQEKAAVQENQNTWGVHFVSSTSSPSHASLFEGISFSGSPSTTIFLNTQLIFSDPAPGNAKDIVFLKVSGWPQNGETTTKIIAKQFQDKGRRVEISSNGNINIIRF